SYKAERSPMENQVRCLIKEHGLLFPRAWAYRASMQITERSTLRSSCHSQLAIAAALNPIRAACGARFRGCAGSAPGGLGLRLEQDLTRFVYQHTEGSLCQALSPTYC